MKYYYHEEEQKDELERENEKINYFWMRKEGK